MDFYIGQKVRISEPFNLDDAYQGEFTIKEINIENNYVIFEEMDSAFDFKYLIIEE